jgi:MFS family permease
MWPAYRSLIARPGATALLGAGLLARAPIATYGIGLLLLVVAGHGSYALAGAVAAAYGLAAVVAGPLAGRHYDRYGQARLLPIATAAQAVALVAVVGCVRLAAPVPVLLAATALLGLSVPQAGVLVRSRWAAMLDGSGLLHRALFLEGAIDELTFVAGPVLLTAVGRLAGPATALLAAGAVTSAGTLLLARQRSTDPGRVRTVGSRSWRSPGFIALCTAFAAVGAVFGCIQVGVVAATRASGDGWAAGPVLAGFAAISLVAGLVLGARPVTGPPGRRYRRAVAVLAAGMVLPALAVSPPLALSGSLVVAACAASPAVATGYAVAQCLIPAPRLAEGLGFVTAGLSLGLAAGTALAGLAADAGGARAVFLCAAGIGGAGILAAGRQPPAARSRVAEHSSRTAVGGTRPSCTT